MLFFDLDRDCVGAEIAIEKIAFNSIAEPESRSDGSSSSSGLGYFLSCQTKGLTSFSKVVEIKLSRTRNSSCQYNKWGIIKSRAKRSNPAD